MNKIMRNVYYDTVGIPLLYRAQVYKAVVDLVGPEKVLYGSDYPLLLYPCKIRKPNFDDLLNESKNSGLTDAELFMVLGGNTRRILNLE